MQFQIQFELLQLHGFLHIAVYTHTFLPGSLKLHTTRETYQLDYEVEELGPDELSLVNTRRWLQKSEEPYPGYCRGPASDKCIPALCNCAKLKEIHDKLKEKERRALIQKLEILKAKEKPATEFFSYEYKENNKQS